MHFTPIEHRIMTLLSDGLPHDRSEVLACLNDPLAKYPAIGFHIFQLRAKVRPAGHEIVTELYKGGIHYRHVILLSGKPSDSLT